MLPRVYMVKFNMLNPNLTSKITKNLNQSQKHRKKRLSTKIKHLKNSVFDVLEHSLVGLRPEFDRILPWGVLYLSLKLKLVLLYLIMLIKLINNLIRTLIKLL